MIGGKKILEPYRDIFIPGVNSEEMEVINDAYDDAINNLLFFKIIERTQMTTLMSFCLLVLPSYLSTSQTIIFT